MRCKNANKLISTAHDGQLDAASQHALNNHLAGCDECRTFAKQLTAINEQLSHLCAPEVRWGLAQRILARLPEHSTQPNNTAANRSALPRRWADLFKPGPVGVSLASLFVGVWMGGSLIKLDQAERDIQNAIYANELAGIFDPLPEDSPGGRLYAMLDDDYKLDVDLDGEVGQ